MFAPPVRRDGSADPIRAIALAIAVCALAPAAARAQDPAPGADPADPAAPAALPAPPVPAPPPPPVRRVGEVTATATRAEREVLDVPGNVTVIDREEIEASAARTLPELLRRQPGIFVTNVSTNPAGNFADARGFNNGGGNGANLLVLVDGRRANEPDTGSADWALLPLDMVESIEIVRGPASALYGDGAVGGVLHIRTRPVEGPPRGALRGLYGRYQSAGGSLRAAGTAGDFTGGLFVDGLTTEGYRDRSAYDSQDVKASLETTLFDRVVVGSSGGHHHDDREFPGGLTLEEMETFGRRASSPFAPDDEGEVDTWSWDGWVEATATPELGLRWLPYYFHRDDSSRISTAGFDPFDTETEKDQGGFDLEGRLDRTLLGLASRLILGTTFLHDEVDRESRSGEFRSQTRGRRNLVGGFAQAELWLNRELLLGTGVRYDSASYELRFRSEFGGSGSTTRDEPDLRAWSPKASLTWRFLPIASAYFSWARGFRMPDFDEDLPFTLEPPDLDPQRSDSFEVGAKLESASTTANASFYWMRVRDEILFDPEPLPGSPFGANLNLDRVRHRGIELSASHRLFAWLTLLGGYTFEDVVIREAPTPALDGARMPITPRHRGSLGALAAVPIGLEGFALELGVNANLVGSRIYANDLARQLSKLDPYQTVDLWLRLRRALGERLAATFSFAVYNVGGERYEDFGACRGCLGAFPPEAVVNPAAGRTYLAAVALELAP
jgi:iron complex outermembrane receptor protein